MDGIISGGGLKPGGFKAGFYVYGTLNIFKYTLF